MRIACSETASIERSSGVFMSSASPVHATNAVGMHNVAVPPLRLMNTGLVQSHTVYPRASNVARRPPLGKLLASGSPCTSAEPGNSVMAPPCPSGIRNASCFSAVCPVSGVNQCV